MIPKEKEDNHENWKQLIKQKITCLYLRDYFVFISEQSESYGCASVLLEVLTRR